MKTLLRKHVDPCSWARSARAGSTVTEILIALVILLILFGAIGVAVSSSSSLYQQGVSSAEVEAQARRLVERIAAELIDADRSSLVLAPVGINTGATSIDYARGEGFVGGALQTGLLRRIRIVAAPGEINGDDLDNNGNGLVDEQRLELVTDVLGAPNDGVGWGNFVREFLEGETPDNVDQNGNGLIDERGLCLFVERDAAGLETNTITIRLTLERRGPEGGVITRTVETAVTVRNGT